MSRVYTPQFAEGFFHTLALPFPLPDAPKKPRFAP